MARVKRTTPRRTAEAKELTAVARGGTLTLVGGVASGLLGLALLVVAGRGLGAQRAGALFEAIAVFSLANTALGADTGLVRLIPSYQIRGRGDQLRQLLLSALVPPVVVGAVLGSLGFVFAPFLVHLFFRHGPEQEAVRYLRTMTPFLPAAMGMTVALAANRGFGAMRPFVAVQNILVPVLRPILLGMAILLGLGAVAVGLSWSAPFGLGLCLALFLVARLAPTRVTAGGRAGGREAWREIFGEFWRFSGPQGVAAFLQVTLLWLDILLVGAYASTKAAGVYSVASRYILAGGYALQAVGLALGPQLSRLLSQGRTEEAQAVFQVSTWWLMAVSWPVYVLMAVLSPLMLRPFGRGFVSGSGALLVLSLAMLVYIATGNNRTALLMAGFSGWNLAIAAAQLAMNIAANILLIPRMGIDGAAVSWALTIIIGNLLINWVIWAKLRVNPLGSGFWFVAAAVAGVFAVPAIGFRVLAQPTLLSGSLFALVTVILYGLVLSFGRHILRVDVFAGLIRQSTGRASRDDLSWL